MGKAGVLAILVVLIVQTACMAADLPQQFKTQDGFVLKLPQDWTSIPRDVLDAYTEAVAKQAPGAAKQTYDYGFQLTQAKEWFEYPYILIQIRRSGRIPESQLKSVKRVEQSLQNGVAKAQDSVSALASNARLGETTYDSGSHILFTEIGMNVSQVGEIKALAAVLLTQSGTITITGYAKAEDFAAYRPVFEAIARAAMLDRVLRYTPDISDSVAVARGIDWGKIFAKAIVGAVIGGLVAWGSSRVVKGTPRQ